MADPQLPREGSLTDPLIVKADEVDQTGTDIALSTALLTDQALPEDIAKAQSRPSGNGIGPAGPQPSKTGARPARPELRRDGSAPPPPRQPPPPAPVQPQGMENVTDSLSLMQLKKIVHEMPRIEQPVYAFEYADSQSFVEELNEWFQYGEMDRSIILRSRELFEQKWATFCELQSNETETEPTWLGSDDETRLAFLSEVATVFQNPDVMIRIEALEVTFYVLSGIWAVTAGKARETDQVRDDASVASVAGDGPDETSLQVEWIEKNTTLFRKASGISSLWTHFRRLFLPQGNANDPATVGFEDQSDELEGGMAAFESSLKHEMHVSLGLWYFFIESARKEEQRDKGSPLRSEITALQPSYLKVLIEIMARLRWEETSLIPVTKLILLTWKSILLLFGDSEHLEVAKNILDPDSKKAAVNSSFPFLTTSPLDYHIFRQEITSKYPAFNPPQPLVPLEPENNSILPPLPNHPSRFQSTTTSAGIGPASGSASGSILHQSVHIATPAPSPPPSPAGPGGKAGKKQNYQTNQNFPFLYPPLDDSSNKIGGKGTSELQDILVGKRWEGSDVPASIMEAGKLFASRMRMTRAMRQMWRERELFMKFDRGWDAKQSKEARARSRKGSSLRDPFLEEYNEVQGEEEEAKKSEPSDMKDTETLKDTEDVDVQARLDAVEHFYTESLPNLQSLVIVLLKVLLTNVTVIANQSNCQNGTGPSQENGASQGNGKWVNFADPIKPEGNADTALDDLDDLRLREITNKGISAILILLLKWFKLSHVLKFEYMTQLLLDSNYVPLVLKLFAHQDVEKIVAQKNDREDLDFFHFCHVHSNQPPLITISIGTNLDNAESEDEAMPPPISRHRRPVEDAKPSEPDLTAPPPNPPPSQPLPSNPIEVDELGYPISKLPPAPITTFSFRNFFSSINFLRVMQKITHGKAHRCLLLVQYKSSTILRKVLKIPDPQLRLYTLKLFKSQVPYCGRKWRQTNMRVITAIYLYCRPELRDEWLAGSDVDADVEEALPLEQALRSLTHWWHLRCYKDSMTLGMSPSSSKKDHDDDSDADSDSSSRPSTPRANLASEERDFFETELENMGWGLLNCGVEDEVAFGEEAAGIAGPHPGAPAEFGEQMSQDGASVASVAGSSVGSVPGAGNGNGDGQVGLGPSPMERGGNMPGW